MKIFQVLLFGMLLGTASTLGSQEIRRLIPPERQGGKPLLNCIQQRHTTRSFSPRPLPPQILSNLFFVADGITRADGRKCVPTARNARNQIIYAAMADGVWRYLPQKHALQRISSRDLRSLCGMQKFHQIAPVVLIYVSQKDKVGTTPEMKMLYSGSHTGFASQNVYLYATSSQMATVVCGMVEREPLHKALQLQPNEIIIFTQPFGYPGK